MIRLFKNLQIIRIFSKKNYFLQKIWGAWSLSGFATDHIKNILQRNKCSLN